MMTKRPSEAAFGAALRAIDEDVPTYVYRVPDPKMGGGVTNWKPCDWMVWGLTAVPIESDGSVVKLIDVAWFETKDTPAIEAFPLADLRKSQLQGIRTARRIGIPYWLAVFWRAHKLWTISDAIRLVAWLDNAPDGWPTSVSRTELQSRFGIAAQPGQLTSTLKSLVAGEIGG
jgi:hypothetical protein